MRLLEANSDKRHDYPSGNRPLQTIRPESKDKAKPVTNTLDLLSLTIKVWLLLSESPNLGELAGIWGVADADQALHPAGGGGDRATMREAVEGGFASVRTLP